jgi:pyruvate dehydrogenase E2 component (dihydrolipoamide acetyltransferase)
VDATGLQGTGKGGRITKGDVLLALANGVQLPPLLAKHAAVSAAVATPAAATSAPPATAAPAPKASGPDLVIPSVDTLGGYEDVANTGMRKIIAKRLTESKRDVPHFYASVEVELDNLLKLRKQLVTDHGVKVSVNDVIIRCASLALRDVPEVNATYDAKSQTVQMQDSIDISIAVATPAGLITPIVPKTDTLGLADIADKVRDLAGRAKEGKLKPEEYQGGTFCISNLGMFGIDEFSAVINPPQAAILAVGGGIRRIVPTPFVEGAEEQAKPTIKTIMTARLSADRRVVDEATVALFLSAFNHYISKPELLLL